MISESSPSSKAPQALVYPSDSHGTTTLSLPPSPQHVFNMLVSAVFSALVIVKS